MCASVCLDGCVLALREDYIQRSHTGAHIKRESAREQQREREREGEREREREREGGLKMHSRVKGPGLMENDKFSPTAPFRVRCSSTL